MSHATSELRLYGLDPKQLALYFIHFLNKMNILTDVEAQLSRERIERSHLPKTEITFNFEKKMLEVTIWSGIRKDTYLYGMQNEAMIKFFRMGKTYHDKEVREALNLVEVNATMGMLNMSAVSLIAGE